MTTVLGVVGVLVVLFVVAAVALRDEAVLVDVLPDRADLALPDDGPVAAADLERVRFGMALRGYRMAQVDTVLDRVARELLERDEQLAALRDEVERLRARPAPAPAGRPAPALLDRGGPFPPSPPGSGGGTQGDAAEPGAPGAAGAVAPEPGGGRPATSEPPVAQVPDPAEPAPPLPPVTTLPAADPPAPDAPGEPVRLPERVHGGSTVHSGAPVRPARPPGAAPRTSSRATAVAVAGHALHLTRRLRSRLAAARRSG